MRVTQQYWSATYYIYNRGTPCGDDCSYERIRKERRYVVVVVVGVGSSSGKDMKRFLYFGGVHFGR